MNRKSKENIDFGIYAALGLSIGVIFGVISNQLGLGISLGLFLGTAGYGIIYCFKKESKQ
jgi:hypothetical protein